jgi:hypothetical protein
MQILYAHDHQLQLQPMQYLHISMYLHMYTLFVYQVTFRSAPVITSNSSSSSTSYVGNAAATAAATLPVASPCSSRSKTTLAALDRAQSLSRTSSTATTAVISSGTTSSGVTEPPKRLVLHVIGADHNEGSTIAESTAVFYEMLLHLAATHKYDSVSIVLIGPNVSADSTLLDTVLRYTYPLQAPYTAFSCEIAYYSGLYHDMRYTLPSSIQHPYMIVLFNAGIWGYDAWLPTLSCILNSNSNDNSNSANSKAGLLLVTSYCMTEAIDDYDVLYDVVHNSSSSNSNRDNSSTAVAAAATAIPSSAATWLWQPEVNPHRSTAIRAKQGGDHEQHDNHYWQCVSYTDSA